MCGKQAAGTKHLGVMCRREVQPWPEASSAGEGSLVSFWGPLGACQETVGLEDGTSGLPDMGAHLENPMQGGSTSPQNTHVQSSACTHRYTSTRTCTHRRGGTYTRARGHRHRHTCMQACAHVHTHLAVYTHTPQAVHVHGRTQYACTRGCTHMHTYAHTHIPVPLVSHRGNIKLQCLGGRDQQGCGGLREGCLAEGVLPGLAGRTRHPNRLRAGPDPCPDSLPCAARAIFRLP